MWVLLLLFSSPSLVFVVNQRAVYQAYTSQPTEMVYSGTKTDCALLDWICGEKGHYVGAKLCFFYSQLSSFDRITSMYNHS